jgi:RNA-directed DNA polymerase
MININSWNDIQWITIEQKVFRLQLRIYKASANQEWEKMYKLQKLLISSKTAKYLSVRNLTQDVDKTLIKSNIEKLKLVNRVKLDGKSFPMQRTYIATPDGRQRPLVIPTIEDRAKQNLAYLALFPQWEAQFEAQNYGFRTGKSILDAIEAVFDSIVNNPKWVLKADISKCFDQINHNYLIEKCHTFPEMRKQIRVWLKAGILEGDNYTLPEIGTPKSGVISLLLFNIAFHGLFYSIDKYIHKLGGSQSSNRQALTFVRYLDNFVIMHPDKKILEDLNQVTQDVLKQIGLDLNLKKTKIVHTLEEHESPPGFTFLGFDIVQKLKWTKIQKATTKVESTQTFITLIIPSKEEIKKHKIEIRKIIRRYKGASQERLIQKLNPIIKRWALAKHPQIARRTFQALDKYLFLHLWKWANKRHPKILKNKLKKKYWHQVGSQNWVFGVKNNDGNVKLQIQLHSKISMKRYEKDIDAALPFDRNLNLLAKVKR